MHQWTLETFNVGFQKDEMKNPESKQGTGEGKRVLPLLFAFIVIIGAVAVYYNNQNNTPPSETLMFSYASPESQGISNQTVAELTSIVRARIGDH